MLNNHSVFLRGKAASRPFKLTSAIVFFTRYHFSSFQWEGKFPALAHACGRPCLGLLLSYCTIDVVEGTNWRSAGTQGIPARRHCTLEIS